MRRINRISHHEASRRNRGTAGTIDIPAIRQAVMESLEIRRLCSAGDLDTTFSGDGTVTTAPGGNFVVASMDTRGGRTVVVGGTGQTQPGVVTGPSNIVAYNNSGNIDTSFSSDGIRPTPRLTDPRDIFIQLDGKILVVGKVDGVAGIARMLANGATDTSFSGDGFATIGLMKQLTGVRVNAGGKILVSGTSTGAARFAAARLNANGTLDNTFSGDGVAVTTFGGAANALAVQSDGKIVLVGTQPDVDEIDNIGVVRLTTAGAYDNSFSGDGRFIYDAGTGDDGTAVDLTPAGKILVGARLGTSTGGALVLTSAGTLDFAIDNLGVEGSIGVRVNNIRSSFDGNHIYLFVDRYLGSTLEGTTVARYDSDGTRDYTFGNEGVIHSSGEGHGDLQADSKIVTAGNPGQTTAPDQPDFTRVQARRHITAIDPNDRIRLFENIVVEGTTGNDTITVTRNIATGVVTVKLNGMTKTFGDSALFEVRVEGNKGDDNIDTRGSSFASDVYGGDGNDTIHTDDRADNVYGGKGNDNIVTGAGNDFLWGEAGDDTLNGGDGEDSVYGGLGKDSLFGMAGNDKLSGMQPTLFDGVADYLDGGTGTDTAYQKESQDATNSIEIFT